MRRCCGLDRCRVCGVLLGRRQIQLDVVAGRIVQILVHSQIPFGRRQRSVAEAELDLIELGAPLVSQLRIGPSKVVGRDVGILLDAPPDALRGEGIAGEGIALVDAAE